MLKIITGPAGSGKSRLLYQQISALAKEGKKSLLIVPDSMSHLAERRLLLYCGNGVSRYARVCTLSRLASDVLAAAGSTAAYLDGGGRVLSMYRAISEMRGKLVYFGDELSKSTLVSAMLDTVNEFIFSGVSDTHPALLKDGLSPKMQDIRNIYSAYLDICRSSSLDPAMMLDSAAEKIAESGVVSDKYIFFDDFSAYSEQKMRFIIGLTEQSPFCTFAVMTNGDRVTFCEQQKMIDRLLFECSKKGEKAELVSLPFSRECRSAQLNALEDLFSPEKTPCTADTGDVSLYSARTEAEECELAAALIRKLIIKDGARLRDIAVVCGNEDSYSGLMEGAFIRYGIPCFFSRREDVLKKPAYAAALGALACLSDGMRLDTVLSYIKCGISRLDADEICLLENYALLWGISGKAWFEPFYKPTCGFDSAPRDEADRLARLESIRQKAMQPLEQLKDRLHGTLPGHVFVRAFSEHIDKTGLKAALSARIDELLRTGRAQQAQEYAQLYDILLTALEQFSAVCGDIEMDIREFTHLLQCALSQYDVSSIPSSLDSVTFGAFARLSPFGVKHLIVLGAHSGALPPDAPSGSIIGESEREELEKDGIYLPRSADKALSQQSDVYRAFNAPALSLTVIRPLSAGDGSTLQKSYVVSYVQKLLPSVKEKPAASELRALRLTAPAPAFELACTAKQPDSLPEAAAAREFLSQDQSIRQKLEFVDSFALSPRQRISSADTLRKLYGKNLSVNASGIEKFNACRFSYFCQFGLRAKERRMAKLGAPEVGTMMHSVVENAIKALSSGEESSPDAAALRFTREYAASLHGADTPRMQALIDQIRGNAAVVIKDVWDEIQNSDFKPAYFELDFSFNGDVRPITWEKDGFSFVLKGKIDRVDRFGDKLKVVDYKTGNKKYALGDILQGKNLQPFIYMLMLRQAGMGENCAALFLPAKADYIDSDEVLSDALAEEKRAKTVRRLGLVRQESDILASLEHIPAGKSPRWLPVSLKKDGSIDLKKSCTASKSQMDRIISYTHEKILRFSYDVSSGDISAAEGGSDACKYCPYKAACFVEQTVQPAAAAAVSSTDEVMEIISREEEQSNGSV